MTVEADVDEVLLEHDRVPLVLDCGGPRTLLPRKRSRDAADRRRVESVARCSLGKHGVGALGHAVDRLHRAARQHTLNYFCWPRTSILLDDVTPFAL